MHRDEGDRENLHSSIGDGSALKRNGARGCFQSWPLSNQRAGGRQTPITFSLFPRACLLRHTAFECLLVLSFSYRWALMQALLLQISAPNPEAQSLASLVAVNKIDGRIKFSFIFFLWERAYVRYFLIYIFHSCVMSFQNRSLWGNFFFFLAENILGTSGELTLFC